MQHAFILGCERSGSTWLSNVLDGHPETEFLMEPFADYCNLFPGFPSRNLHIEHQSDLLAEVVSNGYERIAKNKYPLFYRRGKPLYWKIVDRILISLYTRVGRWQHYGDPTQVKSFQLLNLNMAKVPIKWQVKKNKLVSLTITKELRLNFKVGLLRHVFPQAKFIIIVRHPGAQVSSVMRLFNNGNLGELRRSLMSLYPNISASDRFNKYSEYYKRMDGDLNAHDLLLLWWLINYQTVIEDCKRNGIDYKIIYHEDLAENPLDQYRKIFSFLGLTFTQEVRTYIERSSNVANHKINVSEVSALNTTRDSIKHSRDSIINVDVNITRGIKRMFSEFEICEELGRYGSNL